MKSDGQIMSDKVYDDLYALILEQSLGPGARLNVDALARQMDVSQTPVRQALSRLVADGMVVNKRNAGYRVTDVPSKEHLHQTLMFRKMFEPEIAGLAAARITEAGAQRLKRNMADMHDAVHDPKPSQFRYFQVDRAFHELVAELSGNAVARATVSRLIITSSLFRLRDAPRTPKEILAEHADIVLAVTSGDAKAAEHAMAHHMQVSIDRVLTI